MSVPEVGLRGRRTVQSLAANMAHEVLQSKRCPLGSLISKSRQSVSNVRLALMLMGPAILATPSSSMLKPSARSAASRRCFRRQASTHRRGK